MKLQITYTIKEQVIPKTVIWDLDDSNEATNMIMWFADGQFVEMRAIGYDDSSLEYIRVIACNNIPKEPPEQKKHCLYIEGDECYGEEGSKEAHIFINPIPQPEIFK